MSTSDGFPRSQAFMNTAQLLMFQTVRFLQRSPELRHTDVIDSEHLQIFINKFMSIHELFDDCSVTDDGPDLLFLLHSNNICYILAFNMLLLIN